jgi:hypothetical protein
MFRGLLRRLRRRHEDPVGDHVTGRAHLVFDDGSIVEADMDAATRAKVEYLARRVVAPPPPPTED